MCSSPSRPVPRRSVAVPIQANETPLPAPESTAAGGAPPDFETLPDSALLRERHLVTVRGRPAGLLPLGRTTLWRLVQASKFPAPHRLPGRMTVWRVGDVRAWLKKCSASTHKDSQT